jgi:hypothetical protein
LLLVSLCSFDCSVIRRWIKFEEDVEEAGERWSKPHVATLSLHSLFELRKGMASGTVMLDVDATNLIQITDLVLDNMIASNQMDAEHREMVSTTIQSPDAAVRCPFLIGARCSFVSSSSSVRRQRQRQEIRDAQYPVFGRHWEKAIGQEAWYV